MSDRPLRILFVWAAAKWSVFDVSRGYRNALARQGHDIRDFRLYNRLALATEALRKFKDAPVGDLKIVTRMASESLIAEVAYHDADLVILMSGLAFHPNGIWLLRKLRKRVPVAVLLTESPYEDEDQAHLASLCDVIFTNERTSARRFGWHYLRHAYEPAIHHPWRPLRRWDADVFLIGTGWEERVQYLGEVDWTGIDLRIRGIWPIAPKDRLGPYYRNGTIDNVRVARIYPSTKINLNFHRNIARAEGGLEPVELASLPESLNPRGYEIAACGGFQISDWRLEVEEIFGDSMPIYRTPQELGDLCRYYLEHESERHRLAALQHQRVQGQTFDARAAELMAVIKEQAARPAAV